MIKYYKNWRLIFCFLKKSYWGLNAQSYFLPIVTFWHTFVAVELMQVLISLIHYQSSWRVDWKITQTARRKRNSLFSLVVWWIKSVYMCLRVGWGLHCKCFLAYPVWQLNCLNQSCRWSDLSLARLWCETISPGPWGPPTVKPTALSNPVDAARIHVHLTDHFHVVMGRLKFFF